MAAQWIADNRNKVDEWLTTAREATGWPEGQASGHAQRRHHTVSQRDNDLIEHILDAVGKLAEIVAAGWENFDAS